MQKHKIVVCGATGNQGSAVAAALLGQGNWEVTALTRDPGSPAALRLAKAGAKVVKEDLLQMTSLRVAFSGAYGVFGVTQPWLYPKACFDTEMEIRQAKNIVWACRETGIDRLVFSSVLNIESTLSGVHWIDNKVLIEKILKTVMPD